MGDGRADELLLDKCCPEAEEPSGKVGLCWCRTQRRLGRDETRREAANHGESQRLVDVCKRAQLRKALPLNTDRGYC
mgnify:CR=1 FL=1